MEDGEERNLCLHRLAQVMVIRYYPLIVCFQTRLSMRAFLYSISEDVNFRSIANSYQVRLIC